MAYKNGLETKQKIIDGSKKLFLDLGYNACTFKKIGESLGINSNLITYYFSDKLTLAQYVLVDYFEKSERFIKESFFKENDSPMLKYVIRNRVHYMLLEADPKFLNFYTQTVSLGVLHKVFFHIPYIKEFYSEFFEVYGISQKFDDIYYESLELGSEREILAHFKPGLAQNDEFIEFISSIFPKMINLQQKEIDEALKVSKQRLSNADLSDFSF